MAIVSEYPTENQFDELTYKIGANAKRIRLLLGGFALLHLVLFTFIQAIIPSVMFGLFTVWCLGSIRTVKRLLFHPHYQLRKYWQILIGEKRVEFSQLKGEVIVMEPTWNGWKEARWLSYQETSTASVSVQFGRK